MPTKITASHYILALILAAMIGLPSLSIASAEKGGANIVKGKIGIEIVKKDKSTAARKRSRITTLDKLKVYTLPEFKSYTYVISSDKKAAMMLSPFSKGHVEAKDGLKKFPGFNQFYQFDENSDVELITVICSPKPLKEIHELFSSKNVSHASWAALEKKLLKKSKILSSMDVGKETQIGGFIQRGVRSAESFADKIPVRRGNFFLIKNYEFRVYNAKK